MRRLYQLFYLILFNFVFGFTNAQNLIYKKIEDEKNKGKVFELVEDVFIKTEAISTMNSEFKNKDEVVFMKYNTALYDKLGQFVTIQIPLKNTNITLELQTVENDFYDYVVTNEKGEVFPSIRSIKHYRGIIKGDENSLVALSFGKETANGIVVNINGNFNVSSINETNNTVFFQDNNTVYENTFSCGVVSSFITNETSTNEKGDRWDGTINISDFKCLRIYFELRYDMFERFAQISTTDVGDRVVGYFSPVFNQVAAIYYNEGIVARISELKINTSSDSYPLFKKEPSVCPLYNNYFDNSLCISSAFGNNLTNDYNGDVAQLVSAKVTTSWANGLLMIGSSNSNKRICEVQKRDLCSYAGIGIENDYGNNNHFFYYSWNINVIAHELGHVLGSNHTHSCVWNGNNTAIDNCAPHYFSTNLNTLGDVGVNCYNSSAPILPAIGGTIMSYCHLLNNIGIKFSNGFGSQPGNRIRSKICRKRCLIPLSCYKDLYIGYSNNKSATNDYNIPNGHTDTRQVSNDLYVYNTVEAGGKARYTAGNSIKLLPNTVPNYWFNSTTPSYATGFHAKEGSDVVLKIAYCPTFEYSISSLPNEDVLQSDSNTTFFEQEFVTLYPNPTTGMVTIESNYEITFWELTDQIGVIYQSNKVHNLKKIDLDFLHLNSGVYNIKIHLSNGNFSYKKIIKQ